MTIQEIKRQIGTKLFKTTEGQDLRDVCLLLYGNDSDRYRGILVSLNTRFDWDYLPVCELEFFDESTINNFL